MEEYVRERVSWEAEKEKESTFFLSFFLSFFPRRTLSAVTSGVDRGGRGRQRVGKCKQTSFVSDLSISLSLIPHSIPLPLPASLPFRLV